MSAWRGLLAVLVVVAAAISAHVSPAVGTSPPGPDAFVATTSAATLATRSISVDARSATTTPPATRFDRSVGAGQVAMRESWPPTSSTHRSVATKAGRGGGEGSERVGRWMSPAERQGMQETGRVQPGMGGSTRVARPANLRSYERSAPRGDEYVEFDVPSGALRQGGREDWAIIDGPTSSIGRMRGVKEMPPARCITVIACRR